MKQLATVHSFSSLKFPRIHCCQIEIQLLVVAKLSRILREFSVGAGFGAFASRGKRTRSASWKTCKNHGTVKNMHVWRSAFWRCLELKWKFSSHGMAVSNQFLWMKYAQDLEAEVSSHRPLGQHRTADVAATSHACSISKLGFECHSPAQGQSIRKFLRGRHGGA